MFPTDKSAATTFGQLITVVSQLKETVTHVKSVLTKNGSIDSDALLVFLQGIQEYNTAIKDSAIALNLGSGTGDSLAGSLNRIMAGITDILQWAASNLPTDGTYLLLYSIDTNFELVPRVFSGPSITLFISKIDAVLAEIN